MEFQMESGLVMLLMPTLEPPGCAESCACFPVVDVASPSTVGFSKESQCSGDAPSGHHGGTHASFLVIQ